MCVVLVCRKERPDEEFVAKAWKQNDHGGGIAWRVGRGEKSVVKWAKGLNEDQMQELIAKLPLPFIAHFRITSTGSRTDAMCHPFEVSRVAEPRLEGVTKNQVLFHNGTWNTWRSEVKELAIKSGVPLANGEWNDTRSMAYAASILGRGILEMINERVVLFGPDRIDIYGSGWSDEKGILCSNKTFLNVGSFRSGNSTYTGQQTTIHLPGSTGTTHYGSNRSSPTVGASDGRRLADDLAPKEIIIGKVEKAGGLSLLDIPFRGHLPAFSNWQAAQRESGVEEPVQEGSSAGAEENPQGIQAIREAAERVLGTKVPLSPEEELVLTTWAKSRNPKTYRRSSRVTNEDLVIRQVMNDGIKFVGMRP